MNKKEIAEELDYELTKGLVILSKEAITCSDTFYSENEMKEYWYNPNSEMFFENTEKGLDELIEFHKKLESSKTNKN